MEGSGVGKIVKGIKMLLRTHFNHFQIHNCLPNRPLLDITLLHELASRHVFKEVGMMSFNLAFFATEVTAAKKVILTSLYINIIFPNS